VELGRVGVWTMSVHTQRAAATRAQVEEIEALGYSALWFPERLATTREALSTAALLLGWTRRLVVGTGIANIYARPAATAAAGGRSLCEAYPGRFVLGLGVGHRPKVEAQGLRYGKPVATMRAYLDELEAAPSDVPQGPGLPVVLAALAPAMLDLARERTRGAHPHFSNPQHTAMARERLGPDRVLAPDQPVVLEPDPTRARELARSHAGKYTPLEHYRRHLRALGFAEADFVHGGSDRLVDSIVAWGDEAAIAARVAQHLAAGADHVCVQVVADGTSRELEVLRRLAPAFASL
jgi:probable F420-dependent oxidoreductase